MLSTKIRARTKEEISIDRERNVRNMAQMDQIQMENINNNMLRLFYTVTPLGQPEFLFIEAPLLRKGFVALS